MESPYNSNASFDEMVKGLMQAEGEKPYWDTWMKFGIPALRNSWNPAYMRYLGMKHGAQEPYSVWMKDPKFMHLLYQLENLGYPR